MKKVISVLLVLVMVFILILPVFAAGNGISEFSVNPYGGGRDSIDTVKWYQSGGACYMFMPSDVDFSSAVVYFTSSDKVYLNDVEIVSGETAPPLTGAGTYSLKSDGNIYSLTVMRSANLPAVYISTESGSLSYIHQNKENKEKGAVRIYENGSVTLDQPLKQIKGRGNLTWSQPKKPYNIKFEKKQSVLGMEKAKKWTLLANYLDHALLRNKTALSLADSFGLPYTSELRFADLYVNGSYLGNYIICESVEIGSSRVNITDLEDMNEEANPDADIEALQRSSYIDGKPGSRKWVDIPNDPENITGGYLLEFDYQSRYDAEVSGFESRNGNNVTIKSPEYASQAQVNYIADYYQLAEDALLSPDGNNSLGKHYTDYLDLDSFVNSYILNEICKNIDGGQTSFYVFKDKDSDLFYAAPAWDFDNCISGSGTSKINVDLTDPNTWFVNMIYYSRKDVYIPTQEQCDTVFTLLYEYHADFRDAVKARWQELRPVLNDEWIEGIKADAALLAPSALMDDYRWNITASSVASEKTESYGRSVAKMTDFLSARVAALDKGYSANAALVYYNSNGGFGKIIDPTMYLLGDSAVVKNAVNVNLELQPNGDYSFAGWNTSADGSGRAYMPGDTMELTDEVTVLYAQWTEKASSTSFWSLISGFFRRIINWIKSLFV